MPNLDSTRDFAEAAHHLEVGGEEHTPGSVEEQAIRLAAALQRLVTGGDAAVIDDGPARPDAVWSSREAEAQMDHRSTVLREFITPDSDLNELFIDPFETEPTGAQ